MIAAQGGSGKPGPKGDRGSSRDSRRACRARSLLMLKGVLSLTLDDGISVTCDLDPVLLQNRPLQHGCGAAPDAASNDSSRKLRARQLDQARTALWHPDLRTPLRIPPLGADRCHLDGDQQLVQPDLRGADLPRPDYGTMPAVGTASR